MREIRLSGSMRGRHGHGLVMAENQTCLPTLSYAKRNFLSVVQSEHASQRDAFSFGFPALSQGQGIH